MEKNEEKKKFCHLLHHHQDKDQLSGAHGEGVLICWPLEVLRAGSGRNSICSWMISVLDGKAQ